jgi:hypothetical protein
VGTTPTVVIAPARACRVLPDPAAHEWSASSWVPKNRRLERSGWTEIPWPTYRCAAPHSTITTWCRSATPELGQPRRRWSGRCTRCGTGAGPLVQPDAGPGSVPALAGDRHRLSARGMAGAGTRAWPGWAASVPAVGRSQPPVGDGPHRYFVRLYAVDQPLDLPAPRGPDVHRALAGRTQQAASSSARLPGDVSARRWRQRPVTAPAALWPAEPGQQLVGVPR